MTPNHPLPRILSSIALALSMAASPVDAESAASTRPALPDTPAARLMSDWMTLCDQPDRARMTSWFDAQLSSGGRGRMTPAARAADMFELCSENGGLDTVAVAKSDPLSITLTTRGRKSGAWFEIILMANEAGEFDRGGMMPTVPVESALPARIDDAVIARELEQSVARLSSSGLFSGIVVVARGERIMAQASGGYANRAEKTPFDTSSGFTLGSLGKMFTAVAIGQLVDQSKLAPSDTVGKFFPEYPNKTVRDQVTVSMLLAHTSGLGDFLDKRTPSMMKDGVQRAAEFLPLFDKDEPQFAPGSARAYSNAGLALAGAIVEKVSGESYPDYLRKHVFAPAGMTRSSPNNVPHAGAGLVTPYTREGSPDWKIAEADIGSPAGGAISTAGDLVRFAEALRSGSLVSKAWFKQMTTAQGPVQDGRGYGYATEIVDFYGQTVVGHNGGFPGVSTHLHLVLGSSYTVVVLSNQDPPADMYAGIPIVALVAERVKRDARP